ncbi:MAG: SEC-C domain-containing protein [Candidatus Omnitrophica bacterium]|nr:SEC-C domain-containing protein [Candidatus Omnitrophota bacterium]
MFQDMYVSINQEVAEIIFKIQPVETQRRVRGVFSSVPQNLVHEEASGLASAPAQSSGALPQQSQPQAPPKPTPIRNDESAKVGRNDPCPCGSGKKYKKCCGQ